MTEHDRIYPMLCGHVGTPPPARLVADVLAYGATCAARALAEANVLHEGEVLGLHERIKALESQREAPPAQGPAIESYEVRPFAPEAAEAS